VLEIAEARWAEGRAAGFAKGETAGVVKGKVEALLAVLAARGISVGHEARARIEACKDAATLDRWIVRAITVASVEQMLLEQG
jgi:hypothetical protein